MKKEYTNPSIEIIEIKVNDIIVMSTFGDDKAGDTGLDYGDAF